MVVNRTRALTNAGLALAVSGVVVSALVVWFFSGLTFFGEPLHRDDYLAMVLGFAGAAALLVLSVPAVLLLRPATWLVPLVLTLAALVGLAAVSAASYLDTAPASGYAEEWWAGPQLLLAVPTSWPIIVLVLATPWIRARSRRAPR